MQRIAISQVDYGQNSANRRHIMSKFKVTAALLVVGAMSLGAPAIAAPVTSLSAAAKPVTQESDLVQVRFGGGWHGGGWHGGGWHGGWGFPAGALAAGALIGGAIAAPYYYGGGYSPYYDDAYGYAPVPYGDPAPYYGHNPRYYRGCYPYCGWGG
jgi:hypothetical protein